jgi:hypothetical protein
MRATLITLSIIAALGVGYAIRQPQIIDHYTVEETVKHDCAISTVALHVSETKALRSKP